ncbi:MAG: phosphoribosyl-AMP cyclohydrolase [Spirochaetes bacterium]|nr:phosphoribosyl-AMP cyclohydrolase [Spirochaetota bacterium]
MMKPDFSKAGLIPVIAQDYETREVLMLAYMNEEAWKMTLEKGYACYFSRSRNKIWMKGESSGHTQRVIEIMIDCDLDTVLLMVEQNGGAACHEGYKSCFFRSVKDGEVVINQKQIKNPEEIYGKK